MREQMSNVEILKHYGLDNPPEGPGWKSIRCPLHDDSTASATSNGSGFACFACGIRGGPIQILMQKEGLDYHSAVELAEEITGTIYNPLRGKTLYKRQRVNLSGEARSYEGNDFFLQIGSGRRTTPRIRPRLLDG